MSNVERYRLRNIERNIKEGISRRGYKICPLCEKRKFKKEFSIHRNRPDGLYTYCKECQNLKNKTKRHNITIERYYQLLESQDYKCAICGILLETNKTTHIDHNHETEEVRGLLCQKCNQGIGLLRENPFILFNAIKYIKGEGK